MLEGSKIKWGTEWFPRHSLLGCVHDIPLFLAPTIILPDSFSHAWHGKTGKAPPTPPGGLGVHAVHIL